RFMGEKRETDQFSGYYYDLEKLPYSLGSTAIAFFEFISSMIELADTDSNMIRGGDNAPPTHYFVGRYREVVSFQFDSFLESARRTQDSINTCFRIAYPKLNLPGSFSSLYRGL